MRLVFVGHRCCDHSESSGYDQIASIFPDAGWLDGRSLGAGELEWIRRPRSEEPSPIDLFHVFYGDCSGSALPAILRDRFPEAIVVATAHQPISRLLHDPEGWAGLEAADAVITVCHEQARHLAGLGLRPPFIGCLTESGLGRFAWRTPTPRPHGTACSWSGPTFGIGTPHAGSSTSWPPPVFEPISSGPVTDSP